MKDPAVIAFVILVALTVAAHFAFVGYLVIGGFLAWRWPRTIALHVPGGLWGVGSIAFGFPCPLTHLERWARAGAGMRPLPPGGFIAPSITRSLYPPRLPAQIPALGFP